MAYIIKMPKLGMGMNEGTLLEWFVDPGDEVVDGDPVAEIESEKTVAEITASEDGVLRRVYVAEGETVDPGVALGIVAAPDADIDSLAAEVDRDPVEADAEPAADEGSTADAPDDGDGGAADAERVRASPKAKRRANELGVELAAVEGSGPGGAVTVDDVEGADAEPAPTESDETAAETASAGTTDVRATPKARRRARDLEVNLAAVEGSGPGGAVTVADVESAGAASPASDAADESGAASPETAVTTPGEAATRTPVEERELGGMRRTIADRLGQSYREAVHVTVHRDIDMEAALAATEVVDDYLAVDASVTDLVLVALSATLDEHPEFNATFEDGVHRIHDEQNVGVAVDVENGLITPVLSDVGNRSLSAVVQGRREVTDRALSGEYTTADLSGGTFTVSNLGVFGVDSFTPVINPPEVAILGVDSIDERPVRDGDDVAFRRFGGFDLSFDHRVVDGADAARFLDTLAGHLTDPWPLLLDRA
ncbi:2-oxo acid dehydrogenase subunit E2 [Halorarius halobius]|uniref:2-oxo acid dehydrogenase subunit E2 n=1 Tax=Halorarius halobius TaxID=2962671 RepID=UPI0020CC5F59|nr:2-oxo acid dehydrogenase subunit E2 [Halorarius halobius]